MEAGGGGSGSGGSSDGAEAETPTPMDASTAAAGAAAEEEQTSGARIEFMYRLTPGVANRSFGLNVARMAGLPAGVVRRAGVKARELELATARRSAIRTMGSPADVAAAAAAAEAPTRAALRAIDAAAAAAGGAGEGARILAVCQATLE
jgi:DNA mismatch repair ATPase MutS